MSPQCAQVVDYVKRWGSINAIQAIQHLGITRLAARVFELRDSSFPLKAVYDSDSAKGFVKYVLDDDALIRRTHMEAYEEFQKLDVDTAPVQMAHLCIKWAGRFNDVAQLQERK